MTDKTRSILIATFAMSAAWLATRLVTWHTVPKACLAGAVAGTVVTILMFILPRNPDNKPKRLVEID